MEKEEIKKEERKPCPLCGTMLLYDKWLKVVGVYEEQQKYRKRLELELTKAKEQEKKLKEEYKKIRQKEKTMRHQYTLEKLKLKQKFQLEQEKFRKKLEQKKQIELNQALRKGYGKGYTAGIEKQKSRIQKVIQMAEKSRKERDKAMERVKQLEEMLKKGTTPQIEGFDFEQEFKNQLKQKFPEDEIRPTGRQKGDILQIVRAETKKVGKILYECKKTKEFKNEFIEQIRRDKERVIADYGVIVTWARKENNQDFGVVEGGIIIVHPYGVLEIATFLRETLIQMYSLKLSKTELETKGRAILEFMQSEEFRTRIQNSIVKSREAYESLKKEMTTHFNIWKKRIKIYESIYRNTNIIQNIVKHILLHGKIPENLPEIETLPSLQISPQKEKSREESKRKDIPF